MQFQESMFRKVTNSFLFFRSTPPQARVAVKIILVDEDKERRLAYGEKLTAQGFVVLAAATISTVEKYSHLYEGATYLTSIGPKPEDLISSLSFLSSFSHLRFFTLNTTSENC